MKYKHNYKQEQVQVNMLTQSSAVRDALEGYFVRLRELLGQSGIDLGNFTADQQAPQNFHQSDYREPQDSAQLTKMAADEQDQHSSAQITVSYNPPLDFHEKSLIDLFA